MNSVIETVSKVGTLFGIKIRKPMLGGLFVLGIFTSTVCFLPAYLVETRAELQTVPARVSACQVEHRAQPAIAALCGTEGPTNEVVQSVLTLRWLYAFAMLVLLASLLRVVARVGNNPWPLGAHAPKFLLRWLTAIAARAASLQAWIASTRLRRRLDGMDSHFRERVSSWGVSISAWSLLLLCGIQVAHQTGSALAAILAMSVNAQAASAVSMPIVYANVALASLAIGLGLVGFVLAIPEDHRELGR